MRADSRRKRADYNKRSGTGIFANRDSLETNHRYNESGALAAGALRLHSDAGICNGFCAGRNQIAHFRVDNVSND